MKDNFGNYAGEGSWRFKIKLCWGLGVCLLVLQRSLATAVHTTVSDSHVNHSAENTATNMTEAQEIANENMSVEEPWVTDSLLPKDVIPEIYDLFLFPHLEEGVFDGFVSIKVKVVQPRNHLLLHTQGLTIESTQVSPLNKSADIEIVKADEFKKNQFWVIQLGKIIAPGNYVISLRFSGKLTGKNVGFYRSSYVDVNGETRYIATTKFEPTYARQAFPCFDEPIWKAKFNVKLARPSERYKALSNMNVIAESEDNPSKGITTVEFEMTPPMSTYFTCFIVCDFEHLKPVMLENNVSITVYARPGQVQNMEFTRDISVRAMEYYTKYFGIKYPLPKLDLIAIPDFVSGAMENWGLVTFRETFALITEGESNTINYEQVADTVAHELAHMWFGDLVTMAWWDDLWLNEGFATFLTIICVQKLLPEWGLEDSLTKTRLAVMVDDAALSSHPIIQSVSHPDQITEMFDAISYRKGSAVLVMLESLGPEQFRRGVSKYLKQFKFGSAKTEDLWKAIEHEMDSFNVSRVMGTWTKQMGYPLVTVTKTGNSLKFKQERFLADNTATFSPDTSPYRYKWDIPITYVTSQDPNKVESFFLNMENDSVEKVLESGATWYKVNHKQKGFYRVNYSEDTWKTLGTVLRDNISALSSGDRANLLDDAFSLAQAGYLQYDIPLSLITYIKKKNELSSTPLKVISRHLEVLKSKLIKTSCYNDFKAYVQSNLDPIVTDCLWKKREKDTFEEKKVKLTLLSMACRFELPVALEKARSLFSDWINGISDKPDAQTRNLVYSYGIDGENVVSKWDKLWKLYLNESNPEEKVKFRRSLAQVNNEELLQRFLELAKNEEYVRSQDYFSVLGSVADNPTGLQIVWDFIRNEWTYLVNRFTLNDRSLGRIVPAVVSSFSTKTQLEEVKSFFSKYPDAGAGANGRKHALEAINNNIKWNNRHLPVIETWLNNLTKAYFHIRPVS